MRFESDVGESSKDGYRLARSGGLADSSPSKAENSLCSTTYACDRPGGGVMTRKGPNEDICEKVIILWALSSPVREACFQPRKPKV